MPLAGARLRPPTPPPVLPVGYDLALARHPAIPGSSHRPVKMVATQQALDFFSYIFVGEPTTSDIVNVIVVSIRPDRVQKVSKSCWLSQIDNLVLMASQPRDLPFTLNNFGGPHLLQNITRTDMVPDC